MSTTEVKAQVDAKLGQLRANAARLNDAAEEATRIIGQVETILTDELNLGVASWDPDGGPPEPFHYRRFQVDGEWHVHVKWLHYGRLDGKGKFRFYVVDWEMVAGKNWTPEDLDWQNGQGRAIEAVCGEHRTVTYSETPWASLPRHTKIEAFRSLPDVLELLAFESEREADEFKWAITDVKEAAEKQGIEVRTDKAGIRKRRVPAEA